MAIIEPKNSVNASGWSIAPAMPLAEENTSGCRLQARMSAWRVTA